MIPAHVKQLLVDVYGSRWGEVYIEWWLFDGAGGLVPGTHGSGRAATAVVPEDRAVFWSAGLLKPGTDRADENVECLKAFVLDDVGTAPNSRFNPDEIEMMFPLEPTTRPESSPGNTQWQWCFSDGMDAVTAATLRQRFRWKSHATAMSNAIRLPMGVSGKPGVAHRVADLGRGPVYTAAEFVAACEQAFPDTAGAPALQGSGGQGSVGDFIENEALLRALVALIPNPAVNWQFFVDVGRAIWGASAGLGAEVFHDWAAQLTEADAGLTQGRWDSYASRGARIGRHWLLREAQRADPAGAEAWLRKEAAAVFPDPVDVAAAEGEAVPMFTVDDFRSIVGEADFIHVDTGKLWRQASVDAKVEAVAVGEKTIKATAWMRSHRYVTELSWLPGRERILTDMCIGTTGLERRLMHSVFNLYLAPPVVPVGVVDAGPWIDLVTRLWPGEADELFDWFAHRVQRPGEKCNHALVLGGAPGIGKDTVLEAVRRAVGVANCHEIMPSDLRSSFNDYVKSVLLVINELRDDGQLSQYAFYDKSKTLIAAPPYTMTINSKYLKTYVVPNVAGVVMTTNYKQTGMYLPADDRRHLVCWSDCEAIEEGDTRFADLWAWLGGGGFAHVAAWLRDRDITKFDPKATPRKTQGFYDIVASGGSVEERAMKDKIEALGKPKILRIVDLKSGAADPFDEDAAGLDGWLTDHKFRKVVAEALDRGGYRQLRNPGSADGRWRIGDKKEFVYGRKDANIEDMRALVKKLSEINENVGGKA